MKKNGFTLIELLVVVSVIALLLSILLPSLYRAKLQAKVTVVNSDLKWIGMALMMYTDEYKNPPPTREDCNLGWEDHQIPPELGDYGYLPAGEIEKGYTVQFHDRFNKINTYKYLAPGQLIQNGQSTSRLSRIWVPEGFPANVDTQEVSRGQWYFEQSESPVSWIIYSVGPQYDPDYDPITEPTEKFVNSPWIWKQNKGPLHPLNWYSPKDRKGIICRYRKKQGQESGTFDNRWGIRKINEDEIEEIQ